MRAMLEIIRTDNCSSSKEALSNMTSTTEQIDREFLIQIHMSETASQNAAIIRSVTTAATLSNAVPFRRFLPLPMLTRLVNMSTVLFRVHSICAEARIHTALNAGKCLSLY